MRQLQLLEARLVSRDSRLLESDGTRHCQIIRGPTRVQKIKKTWKQTSNEIICDPLIDAALKVRTGTLGGAQNAHYRECYLACSLRRSKLRVHLVRPAADQMVRNRVRRRRAQRRLGRGCPSIGRRGRRGRLGRRGGQAGLKHGAHLGARKPARLLELTRA